jgi:hypothetical protein
MVSGRGCDSELRHRPRTKEAGPQVNRLKIVGRFYYHGESGDVWTGDYRTALMVRWALARTGAGIYAVVRDCPNDDGGRDCTPFCPLCAGTGEITEPQEITEAATPQEMRN